MAGSGKKRGGITFILIALLLLIVIGGAAGYFLVLKPMLDKAAQVVTEVAAQPAIETVDIVISAQAIPRGTVLTEAVLTTIAYPKAEMAEGTFFTKIEDVVGKSARYDLDARIPLTSTLVTDAAGAGWSPSFDIPEGKTALSMPIDRLTAVSFAPQPGDHVMIVGCLLLSDLDSDFQSRLPNLMAQAISSGSMDPTLQTSLTISILGATGTTPIGRGELDPRFNQAVYALPSEIQRPRLVCQNVIQDAIVLKLGEYDPNQPVAVATPAPEAPAEGTQPGTEAEATPAPVVIPDLITVIVSPQEAVLMNYMMLSGVKLNLSLRNPKDPQIITTDAVTLQYLMDAKAIPLPAKLPYGLEPRVDELLFATEIDETVTTQP